MTLSAQRKDLLLERLERDGRLVARDLAVEFGVSEDSIRRDLRELAAAGLVQRVYGGALPVSPALGDYAARQTISPEGKATVAAAAARLIRPGSTVILDGGTTTLAIARELPPTLTATVVTHSPTVAAALIDHPGIDIQLIGGRVFKHSAVAMGAEAAEAVARVRADLCFLGVTGVHQDEGLTTGDADEAAMKRLLARRAAETWVLATAEKVGAASNYVVLPLDEVAGVITDAPAEHPTLGALRLARVEVVVV